MNKAMLGGPARAATLTRPLLSAVVQLCWTFQKSSVNRVVRAAATACPARSCRGRVRDLFEDATGVAETPRHFVG